MTAQTMHSLARMVTRLLCLSLLVIAVGCDDGSSLPTGPTGVVGTGDVRLGADPTGTASVMQRPSELLLTKTCGGDGHCTVETSQAGPLPAGTDIFYTGPLLENRTTSAIVVTTPSGDTASGHCSLSYTSFAGTCVLTGGTGTLSGVHASVKVTTDFSNPDFPGGLFTWEGTYNFAPAQAQ